MITRHFFKFMRGYNLNFSILIFVLGSAFAQNRAYGAQLQPTPVPNRTGTNISDLSAGTAQIPSATPSNRSKNDPAPTSRKLPAKNKLQTVSSTSADLTPAAATPTAPKKPFFSGHFEARLKVLFYQDSVNITDPTNGNFSTVSNNTVVCPGAAYIQALNPILNLVVDGCVMIGSADTRGSSTTSDTTQSFSVSRATVFGFSLRPGVEHEFGAKKIKIGLAIPFLLKSTPWGDAGNGVTAKTSFISAGGLLTFEANRDKWGFIGDFGFIKKLTEAAYSIGVSYTF